MQVREAHTLLTTALNVPDLCCQVLLRDAQSALEDFQQAIGLSPHSAHIYFNRANLFASMQLYDKALDDYTKGEWLKGTN